MGFIAKGNHIIVRSGSAGDTGTFLYKRMTSSGSYVDATWGTPNEDFETPITNSTWTTYSGYSYINLGIARQIYEDTESFTRNIRFDSLLRLSTVTQTVVDLSNLVFITALVRGSLTDDASTLSQRVIDEFSSNTYDYVLAIGQMNRDISDYRPINVDANDIKTYASSALITQDYDLPTTEAVYLMNVAMIPTASAPSDLSLNVYKQEFIEFLGDNVVAPGTVGKTEMNPDYKAERAINNYLMEIDNDHVVTAVDQSSNEYNVLVISPDYAIQIDNNSVYYFNINTSKTFTKVSLGYYDLSSDAYVPVGIEYDVSASETLANKKCIAFVIGNTFYIKPIL